MTLRLCSVTVMPGDASNSASGSTIIAAPIDVSGHCNEDGEYNDDVEGSNPSSCGTGKAMMPHHVQHPKVASPRGSVLQSQNSSSSFIWQSAESLCYYRDDDGSCFKDDNEEKEEQQKQQQLNHRHSPVRSASLAAIGGGTTNDNSLLPTSAAGEDGAPTTTTATLASETVMPGLRKSSSKSVAAKVEGKKEKKKETKNKKDKKDKKNSSSNNDVDVTASETNNNNSSSFKSDGKTNNNRYMSVSLSDGLHKPQPSTFAITTTASSVSPAVSDSIYSAGGVGVNSSAANSAMYFTRQVSAPPAPLNGSHNNSSSSSNGSATSNKCHKTNLEYSNTTLMSSSNISSSSINKSSTASFGGGELLFSSTPNNSTQDHLEHSRSSNCLELHHTTSSGSVGRSSTRSAIHTSHSSSHLPSPPNNSFTSSQSTDPQHPHLNTLSSSSYSSSSSAAAGTSGVVSAGATQQQRREAAAEKEYHRSGNSSSCSSSGSESSSTSSSRYRHAHDTLSSTSTPVTVEGAAPSPAPHDQTISTATPKGTNVLSYSESSSNERLRGIEEEGPSPLEGDGEMESCGTFTDGGVVGHVDEYNSGGGMDGASTRSGGGARPPQDVSSVPPVTPASIMAGDSEDSAAHFTRGGHNSSTNASFTAATAGGGVVTGRVSGGESDEASLLVHSHLDSFSRSSESSSRSNNNNSGSSGGGKDKALTGQLSGGTGGEKDKKKKAWYNVLNPNYKSRSEDLKRLFKDLPSDERLLVDYSCALQKDILVHGRLYVTPKYFCFYSKIFSWETFEFIKCKDIISMTKEKTALVIPNAIQIATPGDKHFFTTFAARDKTYLTLFRIWQNALMDQQMPIHELWQWVHNCYGDELGLTSDDDDYIAPSTTEEESQRTFSALTPPPPVPPSPKAPSSTAGKHGRGAKTSTTSSITGPSTTASLNGDVDPLSSPHLQQHHLSTSDRDAACPSSQGGADTLSTNNSNPCPSSGGSSSSSSQYEQQGVQPPSSKPSSPSKALPPSPGAAGGSPGPHQDSPDSLDTDDEDDCDTLKLTGVDQQSPPLATVICPTVSTHHNGREVINKTYAIPIDSLFTLLFTNSKLMLDVFASRKLLDSKSSPWQSKDDTEQRLRQVTYVATLPTNSFGPKVSHVTETQVMSEYTRPGEYYSVDSEASNAGIPYADSFLVSSHYCLTREGYNETRLAVFTDVKYKKSMWGFMKGIIDKNSFSGVEGLLGDVDIALQQEEARLQSDLKKTTASTTRRRRRRGGSKADAELLATVTAAVTASAGGGGGGAMVGGVSVPVTVVLPTNNSKETTKTSSAINRIIGPAVRGLTPRGSMSSTLLDSTTVGGVRRTSSTPVDESSTGSGWWSTLRVVVVALLLLLLTNCLLYWRLIQLEDIVRDTHHYHHHSMLAVDPSVFRKAGGEAWLHLLQEQEAVHSKQVEGWRDQVSQAASLLQQAESVLRGLHNAIPVQHAAKITELLTKLQSPDTLASLTGQQHLPGHSAPPVHHLNEDQNYLDHSLGTLGEGG